MEMTIGSPSTKRPRRPILNFIRRALRNWRERHRHPFNFYIHLLGIPCAVLGVVLFFLLPWYWGSRPSCSATPFNMRDMPSKATTWVNGRP